MLNSSDSELSVSSPKSSLHGTCQSYLIGKQIEKYISQLLDVLKMTTRKNYFHSLPLRRNHLQDPHQWQYQESHQKVARLLQQDDLNDQALPSAPNQHLPNNKKPKAMESFNLIYHRNNKFTNMNHPNLPHHAGLPLPWQRRYPYSTSLSHRLTMLILLLNT